MAETRPTTEQIRFTSANTGDMSLDMYLENSEIGGRSVHYLLGSIFDTSGVFIGSGLFDWKATWLTATAYAVGDTFIDPATENIYVTLVAHTSSSVASDLAAAKTAIVFDVTQVKADKNAAAASATAAQSSEDDAAADLLLTNADVVLTHADVVLTAADVVLAEAAKTAAQTAQSLAETAYDNVDDLYLGSKTSDPTLNNDGDALIDGTLYYNTTSNQLKTYDLGTTTWIAITSNTDESVKVSANDTTPGYLNGKLVAGAGITLTENSNGSNETLSITNSGPGLGMILALG